MKMNTGKRLVLVLLTICDFVTEIASYTNTQSSLNEIPNGIDNTVTEITITGGS